MAKTGRTTRRKSSLPKLIDKYYADLADFAHQNVLFEMGTRQAFHRLLADAGKEHRWTLIAEQEKKVGGRSIRPDGTFKDQMNLVRAYWEAKDTADKLEAEIEKKRKAGYPLNNIIFEDTQTAILYQHGQRILTVEMKGAVMLAMTSTSHSFDRNTYLRDLDRFYVANEHAARTMTDWSDTQYFLNTIYEQVELPIQSSPQ